MSAPETVESAVSGEVARGVFGLTTPDLHDRFWAARGVQVVRQGEPSAIVDGAELYLLTDSESFVMFPLRELVETLSWERPELLLLRLRDDRDQRYREIVREDETTGEVRIERSYPSGGGRLARIALTPEPEIARLWQNAPDVSTGRRLLRQHTTPERRSVRRVRGRRYERSDPADVAAYLKRLVEAWARPDSTIPGVARVPGDGWAGPGARVDPRARLVGPVWVGAGRSVAAEELVIGPAILWDEPGAAPPAPSVQWREIEAIPQERLVRRAAPLPFLATFGRRLFDVAFSLVALALTLPLYPFVALAILLEDGGPIFFVHRRQTLGGREFPCLKFRSMRKDAEEIKKQLQAKNQADGPQFFIHGDPRLTKVGRFIRKTQIDELPQFVNVLLGHMSVVGPRPSPHSENQYSPAWREARLSVKPGITGLWQVKRTRQAGLDFQEWIRYDLEYVRNRSFLLDLWIIGRTVLMLLEGKASR